MLLPDIQLLKLTSSFQFSWNLPICLFVSFSFSTTYYSAANWNFQSSAEIADLILFWRQKLLFSRETCLEISFLAEICWLWCYYYCYYISKRRWKLQWMISIAHLEKAVLRDWGVLVELSCTLILFQFDLFLFPFPVNQSYGCGSRYDTNFTEPYASIFAEFAAKRFPVAVWL